VASQLKAFGNEPAFSIDRVLIGNHPTVIKLRVLIERVAVTDATVLITGESGTGKEVVANAIHALSPRRARAFVPVNCAAIPHDLLESEMFGHERGAFTGAAGQRHGLFGVADGGTIFLDEIGEMPMTLQAKMLRVLEDGMVRAVGSDRAVQVDVRVIAATNHDLMRAVKRGSFREDLYYRLNVVPITIPPLRERRSDIPTLIEHFIGRLRNRNPGREIAVARDAMVALWSYDWPGNVRELENMLERLAILNDGTTIELSAIPENLVASAQPSPAPIPAALGENGLNLNKLVRDLEGRLINEALKRTQGNKQAAARLLGLKRTTFAAKLRRCGVVAPETADEDDED
jgi:sigma-54 specific flagellar transcriptional regulator A